MLTKMLTLQVFAFNTLFGVIFAILSWATFSVSPLSQARDASVYTGCHPRRDPL